MVERRRFLRVKYINEAMVVHIKRKNYIDLQVVSVELDSLIRQVGRKKIYLNLRNIHHASSAFLGKLIVAKKQIEQAGGRFVLCNIDPEIYEFNGVNILNKIFNIEDCPDEDDPDDNTGGVTSRLNPPKPAGSGSVALPHPDGE